MLGSNILHDNLRFDILSVWWRRKIYRNYSCESLCYIKGNFDKNARTSWTFSICVYARHYPWSSFYQKNTSKYLIKVKPLFSAIKFSNTVTFKRNARFDGILTSITIIKHVFLRKLFCYESLVDIEVSTQ